MYLFLYSSILSFAATLPHCHAASRLSTGRRLRSLRMTSAWTRVCPQAGGWYRYWEFWQQGLLLIWDISFFFLLQKQKIELLSSNPMCRFAPLEKCRKASCLFIFVHAAESLIFILTQRHHRHLFGLKVSRPHCWSKKKRKQLKRLSSAIVI